MKRKANLITNIYIYIINNTSCVTHTIKAGISVFSLNMWPILPISIQLTLSIVIFRIL